MTKLKSITKPPRPFTKALLDELYLSKASTELAVTLGGMQWHCLLTRLADEPLTPLGESILRAGAARLVEQLRKACSEDAS